MSRNSMYQITPPWEFDKPLCAEIGTEMYYFEPKDVESMPKSGYDSVKKLCLKCPHQEDCLEWGIRYENHGLWGGASENRRKEIRKERGIVLNEDLDRSS